MKAILWLSSPQPTTGNSGVRLIFRKAVAACLLWIAFSAPEVRATEIALVGAANFPTVAEEPATATSGVAGIGGGALFGLSLIPFMLDLQMGALYMQRRMNTLVGLTTTANTRKAIEIPVIVRFIPVPVFSIGAGGYVSHTVGELSRSVTVNSGVSSNSSLSYEDANRATLDFGLVASADVRFPLARPFFIVADMRYLWGLRNVDTSPLGGVTVRNRAFEFLVGVSLAL